VDELARSGVSHACVCPGARSTPLALLLRQHAAIRVWTHLDERSAAFFALGMAKAGREPVVVVSTSGTAAVNFAPAVVEAYYARVPLLVLTADRPPELRYVGALQTIDQLALYGSHVKWFVEMALPERSADAVRYARTIACRAIATARSDAAGPVHVNFPFREPLIPASPGGHSIDHRTADADGRSKHDGPASLPDRCLPYLTLRQSRRRPDPDAIADLATELRAIRRGLIVCGPQDDPHFATAVAQVAAELCFPILADPLSLVRCGPHHGRLIIDSYDLFLRDEETVSTLRPEIILRFGAVPASKPLANYLQRHAGCRQLLVDVGLADGGAGWNDPTLSASDALQTHPGSFCEALLAALRAPAAATTRATLAPSEWADRWAETGERAWAAARRRLEAEPNVSEPSVFMELADLLPAGATLFVGNSMPIRDLDGFFPGHARSIRILANRGASGIDGVVSSALGVSAVAPGPVVLVIGDLSFYHDMNGLLAARRHDLTVTIVLLNNDGGGIFSFLPQGDEVDAEHFEELFGASHGLDFRPAAALYGLAYRRVLGRAEFRSAIDEALGCSGVSLIEVATNRQANAELHRDLWRAAAGSHPQPPARSA
jgi:2-succinyl-5-enolpyruvyl-6-hydroxy-3-cyclohexene-1-carboxylate synthase